MRFPLRPLFAIAAATAWLTLPSCRKERLLLKEDPDAIGQFCRIDTFSFGGPPAYYQQMAVSYNLVGDPASIGPLTSYLYGFAFDSIYFRYDKHGRLVDYFHVFPDHDPNYGFSAANIDFWQRFTYPEPGIVVDSSFDYDGPGIPPVNNPPAGYENVLVYRYRLDEQGRTIKTEMQFITGTGDTSFTGSSYTTYDRKGNAVVPGAVYDDKININRTNKVWQLLNQDYSRNNLIHPAPANFPPNYPASPYAYDKWGLPTILVATPSNPTLEFFGYFSIEAPIYMVVSYSCDEQGSKLPSFSTQ